MIVKIIYLMKKTRVFSRRLHASKKVAKLHAVTCRGIMWGNSGSNLCVIVWEETQR